MATKKKETKKSQRWSIGVFRRQTSGKLVTVYVSKEGVPPPYEQKRVGDNEILYHDVYTGMPYREARQQLLKAAAGAGHAYEVEPEEEDEPEEEKDEPKKKAEKKSSSKKAKAKK